MTPGIHPPCTPQASCQPMRCHPTPPPCANPERCLSVTTRKGIAPCQSAVSIMATKSKSKCQSCGRFKCSGKPSEDLARHVPTVEEFLDRKTKEAFMKKRDRLTGSCTFEQYLRAQGTPRAKADCCAGHGHRGRLAPDEPDKKCCGGKKKKRPGPKKRRKCTIL